MTPARVGSTVTPGLNLSQFQRCSYINVDPRRPPLSTRYQDSFSVEDGHEQDGFNSDYNPPKVETVNSNDSSPDSDH